MLSLEAQFSQNNVPYTQQDFAIDALFKIIPQATTPTAAKNNKHLPMNLTLLIDNSGSMYEQKSGNQQNTRINLAIEAAKQAVSMLNSQDIISIVAFSNYATVVQPATQLINLPQIMQNIEKVKSTLSQGTHIPKAMEAGIQEVSRHLSRDRINRVILLTDGITEDPEQCTPLARLATDKNISFSVFGVGEGWNENLLRAVADNSGGRWYYIEQAPQISQMFQEEFGALLNSTYSNVRLGLRLFQNDLIREAKIASPDIRDLTINSIPGTKTREISLGPMQPNEPYFVMCGITLSSREPGNYNIIAATLSYDLPGLPTQTSTPVYLAVGYVTDPSVIYKNSEVLRCMDDVQLDKMIRKATELAANGDKKRATQLFENAQTLSERRSNKRVTRLIDEALSELGTNGKISRKTQLQALNQSRKTQLQPDE